MKDDVEGSKIEIMDKLESLKHCIDNFRESYFYSLNLNSDEIFLIILAMELLYKHREIEEEFREDEKTLMDKIQKHYKFILNKERGDEQRNIDERNYD